VGDSRPPHCHDGLVGSRWPLRSAIVVAAVSLLGGCATTAAPEVAAPLPCEEPVAAAPMPAADRLAVAQAFPAATLTLSPPRPGDQAAVPGQQAWDTSLMAKRVDAHYEVVLARMSADFPATMGQGTQTTPLHHDVLVWAVVGHRIPSLNLGSNSSARPAGVAPPRPSCYLADAVDSFDAGSGMLIDSVITGSGG
jgi:hypothetical protein